MTATADAEPSSIDRVDAVALAAAVVLAVLSLAYGVLLQRLLLGILAGAVLATLAVGVVAARRVDADLPAFDPDRIDAAALGAAGVLGVLTLAFGVLQRRILLAVLVAAFLGGVAAGALVVRRVV